MSGLPVVRRESRSSIARLGEAAILFVLVSSGCRQAPPHPVQLPEATVAQRDLVVGVQGTGVVEPIDTVVVKAKASGIVLRMPKEIGDDVKQGELIAQIDPHDVRAQYESAVADDVASAAALHAAEVEVARVKTLLAGDFVAQTAYDSVYTALADAQAALAEKRAGLDLARHNFAEVTVRAPISGTVIAKEASEGQLMTSAISTYSDGAALETIANLSQVRMRVDVGETDLANLRVGENAQITVDAFPGRTFRGVLQKIEPEAVVDQDVTFFPVYASIDNPDRSLLPGMNGEVTISGARASNVLAVPTDALRERADYRAVARVFNMSGDSLVALLRPELRPSDDDVDGDASARFAVVARPDGTCELRLVHVGLADAQAAEVRDGLVAGERVVLLGAAGLTEGGARPPLVVAPALRATVASR